SFFTRNVIVPQLLIEIMWILAPQKIPAVLALLAIAAALLVIPERYKKTAVSAAFFSAVIAFGLFSRSGDLIISEYKGLSRALTLPDAEITAESHSPYGVLQSVSSPSRYAPGLSMSFQDSLRSREILFKNGDWLGPVIVPTGYESMTELNYTTHHLPYFLYEPDSILIVNAETGVDVFHALVQNAHNITCVEEDPSVVSMVRERAASENGSVFDDRRVSVISAETRTFLHAGSGQYDLITMPVIGFFGGNTGLNSLREYYDLTKESFREMWMRLNGDGTLCLSCWMDYPVRYPLKLLATVVEMLREEGITEPADHIISIRSWGTITFLVKKESVTEYDADRTKEFCELMYFDPVILPEITSGERARFNLLQDTSFFDYVDTLIASERHTLYDDYSFDIRPAVDNRPFFAQFLRWKEMPELAGLFGGRQVPFLELGYFIVVLSLILISAAAFILILLPLFKTGWQGRHKHLTFLYFTGIGIGYMFLEIVLIQRFVYYFGDALFASAAVISILLVCSGIGSFYSSKLRLSEKTVTAVFAAALVCLAAHYFFLQKILEITLAFSPAVKTGFAVMIIGMPAFFMGMLFPVGIRMLTSDNEGDVPWAWGINGCVSVISAVSALVIAVEFGYDTVFLLTIAAYGLSLAAGLRYLKAQTE
ncbi:hypothetical protein ACFL6I_27555, partial [candidate division KSB1 bacterium]